MPNPVPEMTWIQQEAWPQPTAEFFDWDTIPGYVIMFSRSVSKLKRYDCTFPTGVYPGKMWHRQEDNVDYLVWYGESSEPNTCSIHHIPILLREAVDLLTNE